VYYVDVSKRAENFLEKLDTHIKERIEQRLKNLSENSVPSDAKFITREQGSKIFRYV